MELNFKNFFFIINFFIFSSLSINLFKAGLPQHYHYLLFLNFVIFFIISPSEIFKLLIEIKYLLIFISFIIIYGLLRYTYSGNLDYSYNVIYYTYNLFVVASIYLIYRTYSNFFKLIVTALVTGLFLNILILLYFSEISTFLYINNYAEQYNRFDFLSKSKNTFGFYILFINMIFHIYFNLYFQKPLDILIKYFLFFISLALLMSAVALASILGLLTIIFFALVADYFYYKRIKTNYIIFLISILLIISLYLFIYFPTHLFNFYDILSNLGRNKDETFVGRGYDIVIAFPDLLIFGAGDISVKKYFEWDIEIHSLFIHVLFSYGIVGIILLLLVFYEFLRSNFLISIIGVSIFLIYYLTHNPIISSIFWMTLLFLNFKKP
tara:strand:+ start:48 stop:1187 length:1140 start_codon:yes stop_codon:yes gene_type:complete